MSVGVLSRRFRETQSQPDDQHAISPTESVPSTANEARFISRQVMKMRAQSKLSTHAHPITFLDGRWCRAHPVLTRHPFTSDQTFSPQGQTAYPTHEPKASQMRGFK